MKEYDDDRDDALCAELRAEARALRAAAPRDLVASIEAALARPPEPRSERLRPILIAAAACLALAAGAWLVVALNNDAGRRQEAVYIEPAPRPDLLAALPRNFGRDINPVRLGASLEQPLRTELDSLAADSVLLAETVLGGVPSPVRRLLGLP